MRATPDPFPIDYQVQAQKSALLFRNVGISQLVSVVNSSLLAGAIALLSGFNFALGLWLFLALLVAFVRWRIAQRYRSDKKRVEKVQVWTRDFLWGTSAAGLIWGLGGAYFSYHAADTQRFFVGLVILGMVAGAVPLLSPRLEIFRSYAYSAVIPPCLFSFIEGGSMLVWLYGFFAIIFLVAMDRSAALAHQRLTESIRLGLEAEEHAVIVEQAKIAAEAASLAKSRLLANMSHELRTPLNGVLGVGTLLEGTGLTAEQREYVDIMRTSGQHLLKMVNDVLDLSQLEAGMMKPVAGPLHLSAILDNIQELHQVRAKEKGLLLSSDFDSAVADNHKGDGQRLLQVLSYLTDNAIKFTERGSVVLSLRVVESTPAAQTIEFSVTDTGIGIAPDQLAVIFQTFTQVDSSSTRKFGGSGLGLSICRQLVAMMGGEIHVDSALGKGSRFTFTLCLQRN